MTVAEHPFRDGAPLLLLIGTPPKFGRSSRFFRTRLENLQRGEERICTAVKDISAVRCRNAFIFRTKTKKQRWNVGGGEGGGGREQLKGVPFLRPAPDENYSCSKRESDDSLQENSTDSNNINNKSKVYRFPVFTTK